MTAMVRGMVVASSRRLGWTTVAPLGWVVQEARGEDTSTTSHWQPQNWVGRNTMSEKLELLVLAFASVLSTITFLELPAAH